MKPSGIGGMAVIEGVMMKNKDEYAVAVRKPNNEIVVEKSIHKDFSDKVKFFKLPIFRGMLAFVDSMVVGVKVLNFSASFFEDEEETTTKKKDKKSDKNKGKKADDTEKAFAIEELSITDNISDKIEKQIPVEKSIKDIKKEERLNALLMASAVLISIVISIALFMVLPVLVSNLFSSFIKNQMLVTLLEGILRITIFICYVVAASLMPDIKRVYMYHGAEHKTINCLESGFELTLENVKWQSKQHKRCGTSFMLLVMLISLMVFMFIPTGNILWRIMTRILLVPLIAGVSYEFIRLAGKSESAIVNILSQPGLLMQGLTTKEPDDSMIEVAIKSVEAVFDWKSFLQTSATKEQVDKKTAVNKTAVNKNATQKPDHKNHESVAATSIRPATPKKSEDEDDEILRALDKYLDFKENEKSAEREK